MMGPTHALGGAAALAGYTLVTNQTDAIPLWSYGVAALGALVPDLDNTHGTILNRTHFFPLKWGTYPLWGRNPIWGKPGHRGMTHSIFGVALFAVIMLAWWWIIGALVTNAGAEWTVPLEAFLAGAVVGYISHIVLDMLNLTGVELLWPLPFRFFFPPWRVLRFGANSLRSEILVHIPMTLFMGWFLIENFGDVLHASATDDTFPGLLRATGQLISGLLSMLLGGS